MHFIFLLHFISFIWQRHSANNKCQPPGDSNTLCNDRYICIWQIRRQIQNKRVYHLGRIHQINPRVLWVIFFVRVYYETARSSSSTVTLSSLDFDGGFIICLFTMLHSARTGNKVKENCINARAKCPLFSGPYHPKLSSHPVTTSPICDL